MSNAISRHIDHVVAVGTRHRPGSGQEAVFHRSWARCLTQHGLDPTRPTPVRILPSSEVRLHQQRMEGFMRVARAGMESLYGRVADLGYMLLLTDADGITVDYIGNPASEEQLKAAGLYVGADWNEAHAGTCGVGTCLIEQTTITCHQAEHFDATHIALTCTSAPLYAPDGQVLGVLDVSALHSPEARQSQHLVRHLTSMYAQLIEDANFLQRFATHAMLRVGTVPGLVEVAGEWMLAFDDDGIIVGANTGARRDLAGGVDLVGRAVTDVFAIAGEVLHGSSRRPGARSLVLAHGPGQRAYHAIVLPPRVRARAAPADRVDRADHVDAVSTVGVVGTAGGTAGRPAVGGRQAGDALNGLFGDDAVMAELVDRGRRLVDCDVNLLIRGETGAGKEVLARALHGCSRRADQPFVAVNCAAIPESLIESELFGYTPGSFTGGKRKGMKGLIAQSDGGTLFLDEIGDMPLHLQTRLLRVLSDSEVLPLGAERPIRVQLHVMAATHRDLRDHVAAGAFREDLYYRLCGATLCVPPLRERHDKRFLIESLFADEAARLGRVARLDDEALQALLGHHWPGNLRELRNVLRVGLALAGGGVVTAAQLPWQGSPRAGTAARLLSPPVASASLEPTPSGAVDAARLLRTLKANRWHIAATARDLGVCRATVYRWMERHRIVPPHRS